VLAGVGFDCAGAIEGCSASLETSNGFELSSVDFGAAPVGGVRCNSASMGLEHAVQCAHGIVLQRIVSDVKQ